MDVVSVVIPTLNRQKSLKRAIESVRAQTGLDDVQIDIIVIDNSSDASARSTVAAFPQEGWPIMFLTEPAPGVATARNSGVRAAQGRWVCFLDDDEEARPDWVARLVAVARSTGADAVFGPVAAQSDGATPIGDLAPYFSRSIERADAADITDLAAYLGTNNSMFDRAQCLADSEPFETSLNEIGGEDSLLLKRQVMLGRRFAWAAGAGVTEWVAERRINWAYVRKRKFLSGQIRVFVHHMVRPVEWQNILLWMCAGAVQVGLAGVASLVFWLVNRPRAERALATAYGGLGKVFWGPRFRPVMYGAGLVS